MLQWSEKFVTGHSLIDFQHKMLISYINQLEGLTRNTNPTRKEVEFCLQLIGFMDTYITVHFAEEETCMESYRCPVKHENQKAHQDFQRFFRRFKARFDAEGCRPDNLTELHQASSAWIQSHILQIDMQIKPCLKHAPGA
jgi:hemerythrin